MSFNNKVLVGNWAEERLETNYQSMLFLRKRERGDLLLQKSRTLFNNMLKQKKMLLSGQYVLNGYNVQIIATEIKVPFAAHKGSPEYGLALSSVVLPRQVDCMQNLVEGCLMSLSAVKDACCRNTFFIISANDESPPGAELCYGEEFYIKSQNADSKASPLYVSYSATSAPSSPDRIPIHLSQGKNCNCRWVAVPLLPKDRLQLISSPILTNSKLLIINRVADLPLCVMNQNWMVTFFGPECGISCRKYFDQYQTPGAENVFSLVSDVVTKKQH